MQEGQGGIISLEPWQRIFFDGDDIPKAASEQRILSLQLEGREDFRLNVRGIIRSEVGSSE